MRNTYPIQTNFTGGEITPRLHAREDTEIYGSALEYCINFIPTPQGSLLMRPPTQYKADAVGDSAFARLFTFQRPTQEDVVVELNDTTIRLISQDGDIIEGDTGQLFRDPTFLNGFAEWNILKDVNVNYLNPPIPQEPNIPVAANTESGVGCSLPQVFGNLDTGWDQISQLVGFSNGDDITFKVSASAFRVQQYMDEPYPDSFLNIKIGTTEGAGDILDYVLPLPTEELLVDYEFTWTSTTTQAYITLSTGPVPDDPTYWITRRVNIRNLDIRAQESVVTANAITFTSPWPPELSGEIQTTMDSAKGYLFFFQKDTPIHWLTYDQDANAWAFEAVPFTAGEPIDTDWTVDNGYPRTGTIFQGRLYVGGSIADPSTIWASEVWNYLNFVVPTTPTPEDPIKFVLSTAGSIQWMDVNGSNVVTGTDRNEVVANSASGVISSEDFQFNSDSFWGSPNHEPIFVNGDLVFMTSDRAHLRRLYNASEPKRAFDTTDASFFGEHILRRKLRDIEYAQVPMYQMFGLLTNGRFAVCTFDEKLDIQAWWQMVVGDEVLAITITRDLEATALWMIVRRDGELKLESLIIDEDVRVNLDSYVVGTLDPTTKIASGFEVFAEQTISVVLTGTGRGLGGYQVHPDVTVEADGTVQLEDWANGVPIGGYKYVAGARTLPPATRGNREGTDQGSLRRWPQIQVRLFNSAIPLLNGQRPEPRQAEDPMDSGPPLTTPIFPSTQDYEVEDLDWNRGQIAIVQDVPIRTEIVGLFGKASTRKL